MTDLQTQREKLIRARDFLRARMQIQYLVPRRDYQELEAIEEQLAQLEARQQVQPQQ